MSPTFDFALNRHGLDRKPDGEARLRSKAKEESERDGRAPTKNAANILARRHARALASNAVGPPGTASRFGRGEGRFIVEVMRCAHDYSQGSMQTFGKFSLAFAKLLQRLLWRFPDYSKTCRRKFWTPAIPCTDRMARAEHWLGPCATASSQIVEKRISFIS